MKPQEINLSGGVRNDISEERFTRSDMSEGINVEVDDTGKTWRRLGYDPDAPIDAASFHSLWGKQGKYYAVKNNVLQHILPDLSLEQMMPVRGRVAYQNAISFVFASDGVSSWQLVGNSARKWGIDVPPLPTHYVGFGNLRAGTYLFTMTYVRDDGEESGAPLYGSVTVPDASGLAFTLPVSNDLTVTEKRLYVSDVNGEMPYLVGVYANSDTVASLTALPELSFPCRTQGMGPAPAGDVLGLYKGRMYVAQNNYLWYSQPYEFGLFKQMENFLGFSSPVLTFAAVSDGIFLGTDEETSFLQGDDPAEFTRSTVTNYGTILGTEATIPNIYLRDEPAGESPIWMSKRGACVGFNGGGLKNLTGERYIPPEGVLSGASLLKVRGGTPHFISTLFD